MKEYIDKHEVYDTLANKLTWLMSLGDEVYLSVGNEIRNVLNEQPTITEAEIRAKAIDDFVENISLEISESLIWGMLADCFKYKNMSDTSDKIVDYIIKTSKKIAEQLKAGEQNE